MPQVKCDDGLMALLYTIGAISETFENKVELDEYDTGFTKVTTLGHDVDFMVYRSHKKRIGANMTGTGTRLPINTLRNR